MMMIGSKCTTLTPEVIGSVHTLVMEEFVRNFSTIVKQAGGSPQATPACNVHYINGGYVNPCSPNDMSTARSYMRAMLEVDGVSADAKVSGGLG
jgi:hypothetical protein